MGESRKTCEKRLASVKRWGPLIIASSVAVFFVVSLSVAVGDRTVWWADRARYGEASVNLYRALTHQSFTFWIWKLFHVLAGEAPLLPWLAQIFVPAGKFFPHPQTALLILIPCVQTITLTLLALALLKLRAGYAATAAATIFIASTPLFFGFSFLFFVEPLLGMAVAMAVLLLAYERDLGWGEIVIAAVGVVGIGMLAKVSAILFQGPFIAGIFGRRVFARIRKKSWGPAFCLPAWMVLILVVTASIWSVSFLVWLPIHWTLLVSHVKQIPSGSVFRGVGSHDSFVAKLGIWIESYGEATLFFPAFRSFAVLFGAGALVFTRVRKRSWRSLDLAALCSLVVIAGFVGVSAMMVQEDLRFGYPLVVPIAVCVGWVLAEYNALPLTLAIIILFTFQFCAIVKNSHQAEIWRFGAAELDSTRLDRIERAAEELCRTPQRALKRVIIASKRPGFDDDSLEFYGRLLKIPDCTVTGVVSPEYRPQETTYRNLISGPYDQIVFDSTSAPAGAVPTFESFQKYLYDKFTKNPAYERVTRADLGVEIFRRKVSRFR